MERKERYMEPVSDKNKMNWQEVVSDVEIFGLDGAVKGAKYSYAIDQRTVDATITPTTVKLAQSAIGSGHDNFLNGVIVQFDLYFSNKAWVEAERYHFLISSVHNQPCIGLQNSIWIQHIPPIPIPA